MPELVTWEGLAVLLAVAYLVLAIRQNIWCWAAAAVSTLLYLFIMYGAGLYMESALQVFYLAMAAYGWFQWRRHADSTRDLKVSTWALRNHLVAIAVVLLLVLISGGLLAKYSNAALPHLDSFTTWGAVVATWMVARKILENWLYWFVIDLVSVGLYTSRLFSEALGRDVLVINDADAAGIAEMRVGAGVGHMGTVAILTFGTGIGSAVFCDGHLLSNTELGHIEFKGSDAEHYISGKMRNELSWKQWTKRVNQLVRHLDFVLGLDFVILGGGISKSWKDFGPLIDVPVEIVPAELRNYAGIVGAAMATDEAFPEN